MKNTYTSYKNQKGAAIIIVVLFFVVIASTLLIGVVSPISSQIRNSNEFLKSKQSYTIADAQAENALYRLNSGRSDAPSTLSLLGSQATAALTDVGEFKQIVVSGVVENFQRNVQAQFRQDAGVAFNYGLQAGIGGIQLSGSAYVDGNVYSNGDISGNGGSGWYTTYITGSATVANASDPIPHIVNTTSDAGDTSAAIGQTNTNQDFAQSFVYGTSSPITEATVYIKKTSSNPANATIKIVNNSSGQPGSTVLSSGSLNASLVTTLYSYVSVAMNTTTSLVPGTTYWMVIDVPSNDASKYYTIGMNDNIFSGATKQGRLGTSWGNLATTTADIKFEIQSGGDVGSITGMGVGTSGTGSAWAHTVTNTTITGALYCQTGSGNNKACDTSRADPTASNMPISSGNITEWKALAEAGGSTSSLTIGGVASKTLGPIKINGDLKVEGSGKLYITGPIYVTGKIEVGGDGKIYVHSSMGSASGLMVSDGIVILEGSGGIYGSGSAGSYVVVVTTSTCTASGSGCSGRAMKVSGAAGSVVVAAPYGTVEFEGSVGVKSVAAKTMIMSGTSHVTYDSGLASLDFTSGPSGAWSVESWQEVEDN